MRRSGLITKKIGMTRLFDDNGRAVGVTVLSVGDSAVIGSRTMDKNGYSAVVMGMSEAKEKHAAKPQIASAKKDGVKLFRKVSEFRVSPDCIIPVGTIMSAGHFVAGQFVDVQGTSKGKGFQGSVKKYHFGGLEASHGVLKAHRALGSIGMREWPGRVFKGRKMAGQMGNETVSVQNLKIFGVDEKENLIFVEGSVPGANGTFIMVMDSVKKEQKDLPMPTKQTGAAAAEPQAEEAAAETPATETVAEQPAAAEAPAEALAEKSADEGKGE